MSPKPTWLLRARLTAQMLTGERASDPLMVAERLLAIQAQDPRGGRLAVRARSEGLSAADIDRALTEERSLIITTVNRGTLHLIRSDDYAWLHALTTPQLETASRRRLKEEGLDAGTTRRGVAAIERALSGEGPLTRDQLRERVCAAGVRTEGQAFIHIVHAATLRGLIVRGPMIGGKHAFALVRDWLGEPGAVDRDVALAELARRYLAGHGPASERDLARWAGVTLADARKGLAAAGREIGELGGGLLTLKNAPEPAPLSPPRLLGAFEPVLLGWADRKPILGGHGDRVVRGGLFKPFAIVRGRAAGLWSLTGNDIRIEPFDEIAKAHTRALENDGADVVRFLG